MPPPTNLPRSHDSASSRVARELRTAIVELKIKPGERLSEAEIAQLYNISRQPVREAFITLMHEGLLRIEPQRGTTIVKLSKRRMLDARFIREAVEIAIVKRGCVIFDPHFQQTARVLIQQQEEAARNNDHMIFRRLDSMFHGAIAEGAGCASVWSAIEIHKTHMDRICMLTLHDTETMMILVEQHQRILDAVLNQDSNAAVQAIQSHLEHILSQVAGVERDHHDIFE